MVVVPPSLGEPVAPGVWVCVASAAGVLGREAAGCAAFSWIGSRHDHEGEAVENESARAARGSSRRPGPVLCACLG